MRRYQKLFTWLAVTIGLVLTIGLILSIAYKDDVRSFVVSEINKNLTSEISVGEVRFSFLRYFPYASVEFLDVSAPEPPELISTGTVLKAGKVSLLFNPLKILFDDYSLEKVLIKDATLNLQVSSEGETNYKIWKSNSDSTKKSFVLQLHNVRIENVDVLYYNAANLQDYRFIIREADLEGKFGQEYYTLETTADLYAETFEINNVNYLSNKDCILSLNIGVNETEGVYHFEPSGIKIQGLNATLSGDIKQNDIGSLLDLTINSDNSDIPALISVLPESITSWSNGFNYTGAADFTCKINGISGTTSKPEIDLQFSTTNASIKPDESDYKLTKLASKGSYKSRKNSANKVEVLNITEFSGELNGRKIDGRLTIEDFSRPLIKLDVNTEADLNAISKFYKPDTLEFIKGLAVASIKFVGISKEVTTYKSTGNIRLSGVSFKLKQKDLEFRDLNGLVHLEDNDVIVDSLRFYHGESDLTLHGTISNFINWLINKNTKLIIKAKANAGVINLDEVLAKEKSVSSNEPGFRFYFSDNLVLDLSVSVGKFHFKKFEASNIIGNISLQDKTLQTRSLYFQTAGGEVRLVGLIKDLVDDSLRMDYDAVVENLDITRLFNEMGNFGQEVITDKNLKGRVSAEVLFRSKWSKELEINSKSIVARSDFTIKDGELIRFTPMLELQKFLKGSDLQLIRFSTLSNTIDIKNEEIHIPMMEIKSSALDLQASGVHRFDNIVDYKLQLYLSQLMGKKVRAANTEFGVIEDDGFGRPMVFLTMKGPINSPKFTYDSKSVEEKITKDIKKEVKGLKEIFQEEFGGKKNDTVKKPDQKREELQIDWEDAE